MYWLQDIATLQKRFRNVLCLLGMVFLCSKGVYKETKDGKWVKNIEFIYLKKKWIEATLQRCSQEKLLWKYAANLQENTHAETTSLKSNFGMGVL